MPHQRSRHILPLLLKRSKLWPVLGVLGMRQVGKSTLLRDQTASQIGAVYKTLDDKDVRERAARQPGHFLEMEGDRPLIIDEIQKAPDLFDAIKAKVDRKRLPGRYLVSGSTEFSKKTGIRESLTGRIGIFRLYPLTLAEMTQNPFVRPWVGTSSSSSSSWTDASLPAVWQRIRHGGMPGICFLRSNEERKASFDAWLETTCYRDLQQIRGSRLSGDLAMSILSALAALETPSAAALAAILKQDARRIKNHLDALESLFVLIRLNPDERGVGKSHYYLCDSGLTLHLGGGETAALKTWLLNEALAQFEYGGVKPKVRHYRSARGSVVDWVIEHEGVHAYILTDEEAPGTYALRTAEAFLKKCPGAQVRLISPAREAYREGKNLHIVPYRRMA